MLVSIFFCTCTFTTLYIEAVFTVGQPFMHEGEYDFSKQQMINRIHKLIPTMIKYRLTAPPEETYALHRKLAGCFLICTKLGAVIPARKMFMDMYNVYKFGAVQE